MEIFWANGYAETSPQQLADGVGIGKGSLYHAFGSKHELFMRCLERYVGMTDGELTAVMDEPTPIRVRIRKLLTGFIDADLAGPERSGCFVINTTVEMGSDDPLVADIVRRSIERTETVLTTSFIAAQHDGDIAASQDPRALAKLVQSTMIGLRILAKTAGDRAHLQPIVEAVVQAL
jgi:TetR/AcrR family transcriptional repressor of nem operon